MMVMLNALWNLNTPHLIMLRVSEIKKDLFSTKYICLFFLGKLVSIILNLMKPKFKEERNPDKISFFFLKKSLRNRKSNDFTELINAQI